MAQVAKALPRPVVVVESAAPAVAPAPGLTADDADERRTSRRRARRCGALASADVIAPVASPVRNARIFRDSNDWCRTRHRAPNSARAPGPGRVGGKFISAKPANCGGLRRAAHRYASRAASPPAQEHRTAPLGPGPREQSLRAAFTVGQPRGTCAAPTRKDGRLAGL